MVSAEIIVSLGLSPRDSEAGNDPAARHLVFVYTEYREAQFALILFSGAAAGLSMGLKPVLPLTDISVEQPIEIGLNGRERAQRRFG